jgi:iron(III) transport system permease protein
VKVEISTFKQRLTGSLRSYLWTLTVWAIATLISVPVLVVLSSIFSQSGDVWRHLAETVLPRYLLNSLLLMLGVGVGVLVMGVGTAWLVTMCRFPGHRWLEWGLLLPLAAPAYVLAYAYTDFLDYYGPIQAGLRAIFGWSRASDYWFPDVRSLGGAIAMLSFVLYPYVYMLARVAFLDQALCTLEASRSLGRGPWQSFWGVALPLARPAIAAGLALALMETLNDFGTVQYFGVETFTTGIYRTWFGMGERIAAAQLAAVLLLFIFGLLIFEQWSRRKARYYQTANPHQRPSAYQLRGWRAIAAWIACGVPIGLGIVLPLGLLLEMTLQNLEKTLDEKFWQLATHSFILATVTSVVAVVLALVMAYGVRLRSTWSMRLGVRIAALGYAVPGAVIAVGTLIPTAQVDNWIDAAMRSLTGISTGLLISGTAIALIFAYIVRFLAVSFSAVDSSLMKIKPSLDDAARSLGYSPTNTLLKVHAPLMWSGLITGIMLVFVDVMKELPATLVIRPFNFDTLAVQVYQYAADERLAEASAPALAIVLTGLLPVLLLSWQIARTRTQGIDPSSSETLEG